MNKQPLDHLLNQYATRTVLKAFATALLFYILIGGVVITPIIAITFLYVPFMQYFFLGIYIILSFTANYAMKIFIETLEHYHPIEGVDTEKVITHATVYIAILTFIVLAVIYIQFF